MGGFISVLFFRDYQPRVHFVFTVNQPKHHFVFDGQPAQTCISNVPMGAHCQSQRIHFRLPFYKITKVHIFFNLKFMIG